MLYYCIFADSNAQIKGDKHIPASPPSAYRCTSISTLNSLSKPIDS